MLAFFELAYCFLSNHKKISTDDFMTISSHLKMLNKADLRSDSELIRMVLTPLNDQLGTINFLNTVDLKLFTKTYGCNLLLVKEADLSDEEIMDSFLNPLFSSISPTVGINKISP